MGTFSFCQVGVSDQDIPPLLSEKYALQKKEEPALNGADSSKLFNYLPRRKVPSHYF
jgi:hypothetical protein